MLWIGDFYPRPPRGGRHLLGCVGDLAAVISIHALREEGDCPPSRALSASPNFYPRPPRGGRPSGTSPKAARKLFLSTPSARRATKTRYKSEINQWRFLSTPSARRATFLVDLEALLLQISIHALREEGDILIGALMMPASPFLSTPSARRATLVDDRVDPLTGEISIHALREEGDRGEEAVRPRLPISIHALREEGDRSHRQTTCASCDFYPRPPRGGRRRHRNVSAKAYLISIHALREEGDRAVIAAGTCRADFYPRPPRGGRRTALPSAECLEDISIHALREEGDPAISASSTNLGEFLSTPSARRATPTLRQQPRGDAISIHALREEGDLRSLTQYIGSGYFYPRPPRGGRLDFSINRADMNIFLSTPSARRATRSPLRGRSRMEISIHALREEGDQRLPA